MESGEYLGKWQDLDIVALNGQLRLVPGTQSQYSHNSQWHAYSQKYSHRSPADGINALRLQTHSERK